MTESELESAFEMMGSKLKRADQSGNRSAVCPLATWTHTKGRDKSPSLTARAGEPALFRCWACDSKGTIYTLAKLYAEHSGEFRAFEFVRSLLQDHAWGSISKRDPDAYFKSVGKKIQNKIDQMIDEEKLKTFMKEIPQYAFDRGITKEQILEFEIGYDPSERRMIFTVRDFMGHLMGVSGRDVIGNRKPKYKHYYGLQREKVLYGENKMNRINTRTYVVEGFMDVLKLKRLGLVNVVASLGTSLSEEQSKKLQRWAQEVVFIPDADDSGAGIRFAEDYGDRLWMHGVRVGIAGVAPNPSFVSRQKPSKWEPQDYRVVPLEILKDKDPEDLNQEELKVVLDNIVWLKLGGLKVDKVI